MNSPNTGWNDEDFSTMEIDFVKSGGVADEGGAGDDFEVTESSPQAMSVEVNSGVAYVEITKGGRTWRVRVKNTAVETVVIGQNISGNNRIDALILRVSVTTTPDATATNVATLEVIQGTPAGSPSAPTDGAIQTAIGSDGFIRLANIEVDNGVGQIFDADIIDTRVALEWGVESSGVETVFRGNGANLSGVVHTTGAQNIDGVKTFTSFPITPSSAPTTDYQVANRKFVVDQITGSSVQYMTLNTGEAINGSATPQVVAIGGTTFKKALRIETGTDQLNYGGNLNGTQAMGNADGSTRVAQSFRFTDADAETITIEQINLMVGKVNAPSDNTYIEIQTNSSAGGDHPSGTVITDGTSNNVGSAGLSETAKYNLNAYTFSTPPTITSNTKYWIVWRRSGANDAVNYLSWAGIGSDVYPSHGRSTYTASTVTWTAESANDLYFDMRLNCNYNGQIFKAKSDNLSKCKSIGFTSSNVADGQPAIVTNMGVITLSGLIPGATYFVGPTAGTITATPTTGLDTCLIPIGEAISTTQLLLRNGMKMAQYELDTLCFTSDNAGAGVNIQTFIELGFKPQFISIRALWNGDANQYGSGSGEWLYNNGVPGLVVNAENNSYQTVTAQTMAAVDYSAVAGGGFTDLGFSNADYIDIGTIYENGFGLKVVSDSANHPFRKIHILAYGY